MFIPAPLGDGVLVGVEDGIFYGVRWVMGVGDAIRRQSRGAPFASPSVSRRPWGCHYGPGPSWQNPQHTSHLIRHEQEPRSHHLRHHHPQKPLFWHPLRIGPDLDTSNCARVSIWPIDGWWLFMDLVQKGRKQFINGLSHSLKTIIKLWQLHLKYFHLNAIVRKDCCFQTFNRLNQKKNILYWT